jgi:tetratricopeptide (TPR) repeat protein
MDNPYLQQLFDRARACVTEEKFLHAVQYYRRILTADPLNEDAYFELSALYLKMKNPSAASLILDEALHRCGEHAEIVFAIGTFHLQQGVPSKALEFFKKLEAARKPDVYFSMGLAYSNQNNPRYAEKYFRLAYHYDPTFPKIQEILGEVLLQRKAYAEAISFLHRAVELDRYSWLAHYLLGKCYAGIYNWKAALEEFTLSIDMGSNEAQAWHWCGQCLLQLHRYDEAEHYLNKALGLDPHYPAIYVDVGYLNLYRGEIEKAIVNFETALTLQPGFPEALEGKRAASIIRQRQS